MALPYATEQQVRIIANKIISESKSGGGFEVPNFTPATFEIDLPDVDIHLSGEDCADIIEHKYPLFNIVANMGNGDSVILTFICNNISSRVDKGKQIIYAQYTIIVDDGENIYEVGLAFASDESINKSWAVVLGGGAEIEYATNADVDALFE